MLDCLPLPALPDARHSRSCSSRSDHMEPKSGRDSFKGRSGRRGSEADVDKPAYKTDAFRMMVMKVAPCSKKFCHDWTACPFAHPGEKARRRNPRTHDYSGVACPDMKKDANCPRGDRCPYAHNVFEYWLHPTRYRTQICNDGERCTRNVCFFAHNLEELRMPTTRPFVNPPGGHMPLQPAALPQSLPHVPQAVLQGDADSLAAQLAWMRLQNQGSEPYGLISPAPPASSDFQGHAVRGSAHDSVRSLALHNPPTGGVMPEEWQSLGKSFRARSDPGNPPLPKMSYDPGELLHSPWSMDALSRSGLGLPAESQGHLAPHSPYLPQQAQQGQPRPPQQHQHLQQQQHQHQHQHPQQQLPQQQAPHMPQQEHREDHAQQLPVPPGPPSQQAPLPRQQSPLSHSAYVSPSQVPQMSPQHLEQPPFLFPPPSRGPESDSQQASSSYGQLWQLQQQEQQLPQGFRRSDSLRKPSLASSQGHLWSVPERQAFGSIHRPQLPAQGQGGWEDWELQFGLRPPSGEAPHRSGEGSAERAGSYQSERAAYQSDQGSYQPQQQQQLQHQHLQQPQQQPRNSGSSEHLPSQLGYLQTPQGMPLWDQMLAAAQQDPHSGHQQPQPQPQPQQYLPRPFDSTQLQQPGRPQPYEAAQQQYMRSPQQPGLAPGMPPQQFSSPEGSPGQ